LQQDPNILGLKFLKWELKGHFITTFEQRVSPVNNLNAAGCHTYLIMHVKAFVIIWVDDGCTCHFLTQVWKASIYFFA